MTYKIVALATSESTFVPYSNALAKKIETIIRETLWGFPAFRKVATLLGLPVDNDFLHRLIKYVFRSL